MSECALLNFVTVYMKPLQVTAYNSSSTSVVVSWDELGNLTHGVFCGVQILYRFNDSSQKFIAMATSGIPRYQLKNLEKYTWYAISARPLTLEGEGKKSDEVLIRTAEDGK